MCFFQVHRSGVILAGVWAGLPAVWIVWDYPGMTDWPAQILSSLQYRENWTLPDIHTEFMNLPKMNTVPDQTVSLKHKNADRKDPLKKFYCALLFLFIANRSEICYFAKIKWVENVLLTNIVNCHLMGRDCLNNMFWLYF